MLPAGVPSFYHRRVVFTLCPSGYDRLQHLMRLVQFGGLDLTPLITHRLPLSQAPAAYDLFRSRKALKVALVPD
jgi:threonine dehydrogenase-like Zn-dependent dehydrogenase